MRKVIVFIFIALLVSATTAGADEEKQAKKSEKVELADRIDVVLQPGADKAKAVATVKISHVNPLRTISVPLLFAAKGDSVWIDSVSFVGTQAEFFNMKDFRIFSDRNAVMILMLATSKDKDKAKSALPPGKGELARIYFSAKSVFPAESFRMGPAKLPPQNELMFVTDAHQPVEPLFEYQLAGVKTTTKK